MKDLNRTMQTIAVIAVMIMLLLVIVRSGEYIFSTPEIVGYYPSASYACGNTNLLKIKANVKNGDDFTVAATTDYDSFRVMMGNFGIPLNNQECKK